MWPKRAAAYKGCMYLNSSLQLCSPSCFFPAERAQAEPYSSMTTPPAQPEDLTSNLKVGIQAWFPPQKIDSTRAGLPAEGEVLPWVHLLVSRKADSRSAPRSGLCSEPARCQLLRRVALELRGLCRRSRPTRLEASGGFRNGLVGRLGFTDLVFLLDSSKMAQLARCCSERRSCVEDKQRLPLSLPRGLLPFQQPLLHQARSPWHSSRCCCVP